MEPFNHKKIALAHDFLTVWGGAERVFKVMTEMYPEAPIYTLFYDEAFVKKHFPERVIRASFLQKLPRFISCSRLATLLYPVAVETLDLRDFDIVLSSSGAWMKGLITRLHTRHIAYLHSPMRYVWDTYHTHPELRGGAKLLKRFVMSYLRLWDKEAAARPNTLLVNSDYTLERVKKYYRREGTVIVPPVALSLTEAERDETQAGTREPSFLVVARLTRSKHVDVIIEAFNKLGLPLTIVGTGPEEKTLRHLAGPGIHFTGAVSDTELLRLYKSARALLQASEEDFGLATAEALTLGIPVIAYAEGQARTLVSAGKTGELFQDLVPESIADGVRRFIEHEGQYDRSAMQASVKACAQGQFEAALRQQISF